METTINKRGLPVNGKSPADSSAHLRNVDLRVRYLTLSAQIEPLDENDPAVEELTYQLDEVLTKFIEENSQLAAAIARKWSVGSNDLEDLYQEGIITLWEHFLTWDPSRGAFATYVMASLSGDIARLQSRLNDRGSYRDTLGRREVGRCVDRLVVELGRAPTTTEIAVALSMSPERVELLLRGVTVSLDAPTMGDDSSQSLGDTLIAERSDETLAGGDAVEQAWIAALKTATEDLSPLDFFLLVRRDGLDGWPAEKLSQLAAHLGLGREVLRRREAKARADIVQRGQRLPASLI